MRRALLAAVTTVLATVAVAGAAPARGLTFTDPAGDANGLGGRTTAGSQPSLDVVRVTLAPYARTKRTSAIAVRIDLAGAVAATPGTTFYVSGTQGGCDFRADLSFGAQGWDAVYSRACASGLTAGGYTAGSIRAVVVPTGRSATIVVPEEALADSRLGAKITAIYAGTAIADPVTYQVAVHPDTAAAPAPYAVGS